MPRPLTPADLAGADTVALARGLLGRLLVRTRGGARTALRITETEAYHGTDDLACHAAGGRRTPRTDTLYQPGGVWYVYLVYGMHHLLNVVTGVADHPSAVLIRAVEGCTGPGRLTRLLDIGIGFNRAPVAPASGLHLEDDGFAVPAEEIRSTPRIGVEYAGPVWSRMPWRFVWEPLNPRRRGRPGNGPRSPAAPRRNARR